MITGLTKVLTPDNLILGCPIVYYEIRRGLLAKDAKSQMGRFERLFSTFIWQDYTKADWDVAATLWAAGQAKGQPLPDADLLIAAYVSNRKAILSESRNSRRTRGLNPLFEAKMAGNRDSLILVTNNEKHFTGLAVKLEVENWTTGR